MIILRISVSFDDDKLPKMQRPDKGRSLFENFSSYVVVDIETTGLDARWNDIIEVAAVRVENSLIVGEFQTLVYSRNLDEFITELTGITEEMLSTSPTLADVLPRFNEFVGDSVVVAHNANFDINFIYDNCVDLLGDAFKNDFIDTMRVSRRLFKEYSSHTLASLVKRFGISGNVEHRALADALKTYECYEYMRKYAADNNIEFSSLYPKDVRARDILADKTEFDENALIFGKKFVFTGILEKMTRKEAMQIVVDMGGNCADNINKKTNFLVLGNNDYCSTIKDGKSTKQKTAESYQLLGIDIQVISENVFYDMISEVGEKRRG